MFLCSNSGLYSTGGELAGKFAGRILVLGAGSVSYGNLLISLFKVVLPLPA